MILHCTQKLLKELGNLPLQKPDVPTTGLGNWYANLLTIDRRKCILFTNEKTLYSFLVPKVKKDNLKNIVDEFLLNLSMNLQAEGIPIEVISKVMQEYSDIGFAKTVNKHVLGSMNELTFQYKDIIMNRYARIEQVKALELNREINRTIMGGINYLKPVESLRELLLGEKQPRYKMG
jgi:F0F1-type ATP synthase delta subunit